MITIIKIGGNIIDNPDALDRFLEDFVEIEGYRVLIHGGGVMASELSAKLGIKTTMHNGRRVTDFETLKIVSMVYAGWINKNIVAKLQSIDCNAIGLSGADGDCVPAVKRSPIPVDFGYVGDIDPSKINTSFIMSLLERGITPVFCSITHDRNSSLLNTNADTMASGVAIALSKEDYTRLIYCFEKQGVLANPEDESSVIPLIDRKQYEELKAEKIVKDGMIPKIDNAFYALDNGVAEVVIKHAANLGNDKGTLLKI